MWHWVLVATIKWSNPEGKGSARVSFGASVSPQKNPRLQLIEMIEPCGAG